MNTMRCEQCGRFVDGKPCPFCQSTRVRPVKPGETPSSPLDSSSAEPAQQSATLQTVKPFEEKKAEPPRSPRPVEERKVDPPRGTALALPPLDNVVDDEPVTALDRPRSAPLPTRDTPPSPSAAVPPPRAAKPAEIRNLAEFEAMLTVEGFQAIVICGLGKSGKSEIASGFTRANSAFRLKATVGTMPGSSDVPYALGGTAPGEVWFQPLNTPRKLAFLDPSGEFFRMMSPSERRRLRLPDVTPEYFDFVRVAVQRLAGIVLVVDLTRVLDDMAESPWLSQEHDLAYTLAALRWLRRDKRAAVEHLGVTSLIASRVESLRRLDVPVLVLFSKADRLEDKMTNEAPYSFARRRLTTLFGAVHTHARRYRFDFASTMRFVNGVDRQAPRPCGVLLPMEWLVNSPFRWLPSLPTRLLAGGA
jgi:hypothetical protein